MSVGIQSPLAQPRQRSVRLFLCGDVMTGRGIDQVLPHPSSPVLHEDYVQSAMDYVELAEAANGPIPRRVNPAYIWGVALDEFNRMRPDARIINLETSITHSDDYAPKGINYRMSPENADCLKAAAIDCCVLGNNHVLDFGRRGLLDTLESLGRLKIKIAGAGRNLSEASAPAVLNIARNSRVLVFSFACVTSGAPRSWAATSERPGVNLLTEISEACAMQVADAIAHVKRPCDLLSFRSIGDRTGATMFHPNSSVLPMRLSTKPMFPLSTAIRRIIRRPSRFTAIDLFSTAAAIS